MAKWPRCARCGYAIYSPYGKLTSPMFLWRSSKGIKNGADAWNMCRGVKYAHIPESKFHAYLKEEMK